MALNFGTAGTYLPTIGPNGSADPTGFYQSGSTTIPIGAYNAPAQTDWNNPMSGLGQDVLSYLKNNQVAGTVPDGQKYAGMSQIGINGNGAYVLPGGNAAFGTPGYGVVSGQGGELHYIPLDGMKTNAANYVYNPDGSYNRTEYNSHIMSPAQGVASVIGAGLGFGAIGAMAAGAGAAGAGTGAATTGGTFGAGGLGTGTATGGVGYGLSGGSAFGGLSGATYGGVGGLGAVDFGAGLGAAAGGAAGGAAGSAFGGGLGTGTPTGASYGLNTGLGGEAASSTYGGSALASSPYDWSAATGGLPAAGGAGGAGGSGGTSTMGSGPSTSGVGNSLSNIMNGGGSMSDWLGLGTTALGALAGSQGVQKNTTQTQSMDPRMDSLFYGQLAPTTQSLLSGTTPQAQTAGAQLMSRGSGLLNTNLTPDVYGSKFYQGAADDLQRRTQLLLGQNNLNIQGNSVATGGLGGSRQGVAQGVAAGQAADSLQGNLSQLALGQYNQDATRNLQAVTLGSGMMNQGLQAPFIPAQQTAQIYSPFTGFGTTNQTQSQGGGAMGALGGALGAAQVGKAAGWW
jgi:hypothetical protein